MPKNTYKSIQALERGLAVLSAIGEVGISPRALAMTTGLDRATIYRILYTLEKNGYLTRSATDHRYRLRAKIRALSDGFTDSLWVTQIVVPVLGDLFRAVAWPGNVATFDGTGMMVRESTHRFSPLMAHRNMVGRTLPLNSALGQAFLSFSSLAVRRSLAATMAARDHSSRAEPATVQEWEDRFDRIRRQGYATVTRGQEPGIGAVASAVMYNDQVLACINVVLPDHVVETPALLRPVIDQLVAATHKVEADLATTSLHNQAEAIFAGSGKGL